MNLTNASEIAGVIAVVLLVIVALIAMGALLSYLSCPASDSLADPDTKLIEAVNAVLPQTQCAQCGYPGCRPYAEAIIKKDEQINRCPPGGEKTIEELSTLLGTPALVLDTTCGEHKPEQVAVINEEACIGCTLCILACPVDAIVGASKLMHTVIGHECTGCELCIPPCPVDCIDLIQPLQSAANWQWPRPAP